MAEVNEKCAVAGVTAREADFPASELLRLGLFGLQHRGMEATGTAARRPDGSIIAHRENGYVNDVYTPEVTRRLIGNVAMGHNRYSTSGSKKGHPQPVLDEGIGFGFAHNGNLPVTDILGPYLEKHNYRTKHMNDSEMMGHGIAHELRKGKDLPEAITAAYSLFRGAFSCVAMHDGTLGVFRDQAGLRPLEVGEFDGGYAVASETRGLDLMGASHMFSVRPGELVILHPDGVEQIQVAEGQSKLDMFEIVYFASPDSYLYGQRVSEMRRRMGEQLAEQHPPFLDNWQNTLVVPVPDTSVPAAEGYADKLRIRHRQAIYRNRYNGGRSFMQPDQAARLRLNSNKHTVIKEAIKGLDSILYVHQMVPRR